MNESSFGRTELYPEGTPSPEGASSSEGTPSFQGASFSRRHFLAGSLFGMATLITAPQLGNTVFFPNLAYADETQGASSASSFNVGAVGTQTSDVKFSIAVVRPNEVGFMLQDVANKGKGVPGAKVTITSYAAKDSSGKYATLEATTNEDGKVILDISSLSENSNGEKDKGKYAFWGKVYIDQPENSDYRIFETGAMRFRGGKGAVAPTQAIAGKPYPSCLTMDDVDITYTLSRFVVSSKNDRSHTITAKIRGLEKNGSATVKICEKGKTNAIMSSSGTADEEGICEVSMEGKFFQRGNDVCLSGDTQYDVIAEAANMDVTIPTQLQAITGIPTGDELDEDTTSVETFMYPVSFAGVDLSQFLSINIPAIRSSINIGFPNPPIQININPAGFGFVGIGLPPFPLAGKDGGMSKDAWKKNSVLNIADAFGDAVVDAMDVQSRRKNTGLKRAKFAGGWSLDFRINVLIGWYYRWYVDKEITKTPFDDADQFAATFQSHQSELAAARADGISDGVEESLSSDNKPYFGYANTSLGAALSGSLTWSFYAGPVPVYIQLTAGLSFDVNYQFNVKLARAYPSIFEDENVEWGGTHTLGFTFIPSISLTLGVGFNGLLSAGVTGGLLIPFYVGHAWEDEPEPGHPNPHKTIGISVFVKLFVQLLCFTIDMTVSAYDEPYLSTNWEDEKNKSEAVSISNASFDPTRALGSGPGENVLQSLKDYGRPNTPKQFRASAELKASVKSDEVALDERTGLEDIIFGVYDARLISGEFTSDIPTLFASGVDASHTVEAPNTIMFMTYPTPEAHANYYEVEELENGVTGATVSANPGVKAISENDCVMPDSDIVSFHNVYSDDRRDFIICNGRTFLLRIQTVEYHLRDESVHYRPRFGMCEFVDGAWRNTTLIDFPEFAQAWGFKRMDTYDYDFGATAFGDSIFVVVFSSVRSNPDDENGNAEEAVQCGVYTVMTVDVTGSIPVVSDSRSMLAKQLVSLDGSYTADPSNAAKCHLLTNPVVMMLRDKDGKELYPYFSFVHRVAAEPASLLGNDATCSIEYGLYFRTESGGTVMMGNPTTDVNASIIDLQISQSTLGSTSSLWAVHTLAFFPDPSKTQDPSNIGEEEPQKDAPGLVDCYTSYPNADYSMNWKRNIHNASLPQLPQPWPQYGGFLVAHDDHMYQVSVDVDKTDESQFIETQVDFDGFTGKYFAVDQNGDFLFFIDTIDVDGPINYENPSEPRNRVTRYRIGAAKVFRDSSRANANGYSVSRVFPYAELESPIDTIGSVTVGQKYTTFIASQIIDRDQNLADLRVIQVPHVVKAKAVSLESLKPFVQPGAGVEKGIPKEEFYLTVKNIGNTMITGFTASMYDSSSNVVDTAQVTQFNIDNMELSMDDFSNSNALAIPEGQDYIEDVASNLDKLSGIAALSDSKQSGCLMPGEELVYKISYLIPSDWDGFVPVTVNVDEYSIRSYRSTTSGARGSRAGAQPAVVGARYSRAAETRTVGEGIQLLDAPGEQRFYDTTIDDICAGELGEDWLLSIPTPAEEYTAARLMLKGAEVDLTQQAPSNVTVTEKGNGGGEEEGGEGGGSKAPSTGDGAPIITAAALALGAAGAGMVAYSKRRASLEAGIDNDDEY